jgi:hypothetical protein
MNTSWRIPTDVGKQDLTLTQSSYDRVLSSLDSDRDGADEKYELIRRKVVKFFECRVDYPEDDAGVVDGLTLGTACANHRAPGLS